MTFLLDRKAKLLIVFLSYWLISGAACDTFLEAEGVITLRDPLSEQYNDKKLLGVWAIEAQSQSANIAIPGGDICESIGVPCSVVIQSIDVSYTLAGEEQTPTLNPDAHDVVIIEQTNYPFKLSNIYGPGEKGRFAKNYIGAFIDVDGNGKWETEEPFGWAIENPLSRSCVDRRSSNHADCVELRVPVE